MSDLSEKPIYARPISERLMDSLAIPQQDGMTLREHYAGLALQGMLAAGNRYADTDEEFVRYAIGFADILIRELQKDQG